jgi:hypothetical protein
MGDAQVKPMDLAALPPPDPTKTSWPELVGYNSFAAGLLIVYDRPDLHVDFFPVTQDPGFGEPNCVVAWTDGHNMVVYPPWEG